MDSTVYTRLYTTADFDATGRFVMSAQRTSRIDIQALAAGVYTLRVFNGGEEYNARVVKQ